LGSKKYSNLSGLNEFRRKNYIPEQRGLTVLIIFILCISQDILAKLNLIKTAENERFKMLFKKRLYLK
jgi:hypothetical protein